MSDKIDSAPSRVSTLPSQAFPEGGTPKSLSALTLVLAQTFEDLKKTMGEGAAASASYEMELNNIAIAKKTEAIAHRKKAADWKSWTSFGQSVSTSLAQGGGGGTGLSTLSSGLATLGDVLVANPTAAEAETYDLESDTARKYSENAARVYDQMYSDFKENLSTCQDMMRKVEASIVEMNQGIFGR